MKTMSNREKLLNRDELLKQIANKRAKKLRRNERLSFALISLFCFLIVAVPVGTIGLIVYVIAHFIAKWW